MCAQGPHRKIKDLWSWDSYTSAGPTRAGHARADGAST